MILLLGGLGNVGLNIYNHLNSLGYKVVIMGRQNSSIIKTLYPNIEYIETNILNSNKWEIPNDFETVINLAFTKGNLAKQVIKDNKLLMENIFSNTRNNKNVLHISTTAVSGYGENPPNNLHNKYSWDDYYTLAKSVQEQEIFNNNYPFQVVRIANFIGQDSMFLKALSILSQIKVLEKDFNFQADLTTTDHIIKSIDSDDPLINLYPENNIYWSDLIRIAKDNWDISADIEYDYSSFINHFDNKSIYRYLTFLIPKLMNKTITTHIKQNNALLNMFQDTECIFSLIAPIFRVRRTNTSNINRILDSDKEYHSLIKSLQYSANNFKI